MHYLLKSPAHCPFNFLFQTANKVGGTEDKVFLCCREKKGHETMAAAFTLYRGRSFSNISMLSDSATAHQCRSFSKHMLSENNRQITGNQCCNVAEPEPYHFRGKGDVWQSGFADFLALMAPVPI
jgi:hypothetical protein